MGAGMPLRTDAAPRRVASGWDERRTRRRPIPRLCDMADSQDTPVRNIRVIRAAYLVGGLLIGAAAAWIAMSSVQQAPPPLYPEGAASLGYTKSLILFVVPIAAMAAWFLWPGHHENRHWRPFGYTIGFITVLWTGLDILLAHTFFVFPDPDSATGIAIPGLDPATGWGWNVPIEEVLFYILGSAYLVLAYIWASEVWFPDRDQADSEYVGRWPGRLGKLVNPWYVAYGVVAVAIAIVIKKAGLFGADQGGFPWYLIYLILIIVLPAAVLFNFEFRFVNLPAFLVTVMSIIIIGLVWEVTLALPYGWWNYQASAMLGIFIRPWSNLPIEAAILWAAAAWSNVAFYELFRIFYHRKPRDPVASAANNLS